MPRPPIPAATGNEGSELPMIQPTDDEFHARSDDPYWAETGWFSIAVPERDLAGFVYFYHLPNLGLTVGGPGLWNRDYQEISETLYWDWNTSMTLADDARMFEFRAQNSLELSVIELQKAYRIGYDRNGCSMDLEWNAIMGPHEMVRIEGKTNPGFQGYWSDEGAAGQATGHYEQGGRLTGHVVIEGERIEVDCFSIRDHTWSPRYPKDVRLGYCWAIASKERSFCVQFRSTEPFDSDPIIDTVQAIASGWYARDGVIGRVVSGTREVTSRREDGSPLTETVIVTDEHGRELVALGTSRTLLKWTGYTDVFAWYQFADWEFDGISSHGEMQEYFPFRLMRRFRRSQDALASQEALAGTP
jgi:hypothetical protein